MYRSFYIGDRKIGPGEPVYIIAELSANHNQKLDLAKKMIQKAAEAGADAIKVQTYTADTITMDCDNEFFKIDGTIWNGDTLYNLYRSASTPWEWHQELKEDANKLGLDFFSSPFDTTAVDFLETLEVPVYKVASLEITDHVLLKRIAQTGKPVIMSIGAAREDEIKEALDVLRINRSGDICLLKCTAAYPAQAKDANLVTIKDMKNKFNVVVGLSDHTLGSVVPIAATALGACVIEKHFTLSRDLDTADATFSLEPNEFKQMVDDVRTTSASLGHVSYKTLKSEENIKKLGKSLFIVEDMKKGDVFSHKNVRPIRPGFGMHTKFYEDIMGHKVKKDVERGTPLYRSLVN